MADQPGSGTPPPAAPTQAALQEQGNQLFQLALASPIPRIYVNGVANGFLDSGDLLSVLAMNKQPVAIVNWNIHSLKSFVISIQKLIDQYEAAEGHKILTSEEFQKNRKELVAKKK